MSKLEIPLKERLCISVKEAAAYTGLSKSTVYNLMNDGRLNYLLVGTRRLIWLKDLKAFLEKVDQFRIAPKGTFFGE